MITKLIDKAKELEGKIVTDGFRVYMFLGVTEEPEDNYWVVYEMNRPANPIGLHSCVGGYTALPDDYIDLWNLNGVVFEEAKEVAIERGVVFV